MDVSSIPLLSIIIFLPLVGAFVVGFGPASAARPVALIFALLAWVASLLLLVGYLPGRPGFQFAEVAEWIPFFGIQYKLGADGLSVALVVLTTTLSWISILASFKPIQTRIKEYMISFLVLEVGMIGVFVALDTFLFYIFWEIVLVPMYLIIGIWGGANRIYATIKFVLYTLVGSLLMLVAILATAYAYQTGHNGSWVGAFDFETLRSYAATGGFADGLQVAAASSRSSSPSRSRSRCSRSTPGCRTPTRRPRRRVGDPGRGHAEAGRVRLHPLRRSRSSRRRRRRSPGDHRPVA